MTATDTSALIRKARERAAEWERIYGQPNYPANLTLAVALADALEAAQAHIERNGIRYCTCSRADRMHDRRIPDCPYRGDGMRKQRDTLAVELAQARAELKESRRAPRSRSQDTWSATSPRAS